MSPRVSALLEQLEKVVRDVVAQEVAPKFRKLGQGDIIAKPSHEDPTDLVTTADRAAEVALTQRLPELVPGSRVIGEEATSADPSILSLLSGAAPVWVVDPIDGTHNFAAGRTPFGTMVALVERGVPLASAIYLVEEDVMVLAERGLGAFVNGVCVRAQERNPDVLAGTVFERLVAPEIAGPVAARARQHRQVPDMMCAAHEYAEFAQGRKDYAVYFRMNSWDHVPGALIVREAGGAVRHPDGRDYEPRDDEGPILIAPTVTLWERARRELFG